MISCGDEPTSPSRRIPPSLFQHQSSPSWSHDGRIAYIDDGLVIDGSFVPRDPSLAGVWTLNLATGMKEQVLSGYGCLDPEWSPDGSRLAFTYGGAIFTVTADGTELRQLTSYSRNHRPSWSPDGEEVAHDSEGSLWIVKADGTERRRLGPEVTIGGAKETSWSPVSERVAYVLWTRESENWQNDIYTINVQGLDRSRLTSDRADDSDPAYSPDGRLIAFSSNRNGRHNIWIMNADGTQARELTSAGGREPTWSPDGQELAYGTLYGPLSDPTSGVLWVVTIATGETRQITYHRVADAQPLDVGSTATNLVATEMPVRMSGLK